MPVNKHQTGVHPRCWRSWVAAWHPAAVAPVKRRSPAVLHERLASPSALPAMPKAVLNPRWHGSFRARQPFRAVAGFWQLRHTEGILLRSLVTLSRLNHRSLQQRRFIHPGSDVTASEPSRLASRPIRNPVADPGTATTARGVVPERQKRNIPVPSGSGHPGIPAPTPVGSSLFGASRHGTP